MNWTLVVVSLFAVSIFIPIDAVSSNQGQFTSKQVNESPIWMDNITMSIQYPYSEAVLNIYITYNYSFESDERMVDDKFYLSLDNITFFLAAHRALGEWDMGGNGSSGTTFKPPLSPTLPFDVQEGQTLYAYVEVTTTTDSTYRTQTISREIIMTVIRPYFGIHSGVFLLICIFAAIPILACCYVKITK